MGPIAKGVISNAIWWVIFIAGSAMIAFLTVTHPNLAVPTMYGIITFACLSVIFYTVTGRSLISKKAEHLDATNIEASLKVWIAALGLASEPVTLPDTNFAYKVTLANGTVILVARHAKRRGDYLQFQIGLTVSPEHRGAMTRLTVQQATTVLQELSLELARFGAAYSLTFTQNTNQNPTPNQLESINLGKAPPFVSFSEAAFASQLDALDNAAMVARAALVLALQRYSPDATQLVL